MALILLLAVVPLTVFNGWVLSVMWNWFIPNIFTTLPTLAIGEAIGISLVISAFLHIPYKEDEDKELWAAFISALLSPVVRGLALLTMGWFFQNAIY